MLLDTLPFIYVMQFENLRSCSWYESHRLSAIQLSESFCIDRLFSWSLSLGPHPHSTGHVAPACRQRVESRASSQICLPCMLCHYRYNRTTCDIFTQQRIALNPANYFRITSITGFRFKQKIIEVVKINFTF